MPNPDANAIAAAALKISLACATAISRNLTLDDTSSVELEGELRAAGALFGDDANEFHGLADDLAKARENFLSHCLGSPR